MKLILENKNIDAANEYETMAQIIISKYANIASGKADKVEDWQDKRIPENKKLIQVLNSASEKFYKSADILKKEAMNFKK